MCQSQNVGAATSVTHPTNCSVFPGLFTVHWLLLSNLTKESCRKEDLCFISQTCAFHWGHCRVHFFPCCFVPVGIYPPSLYRMSCFQIRFPLRYIIRLQYHISTWIPFGCDPQTSAAHYLAPSPSGFSYHTTFSFALRDPASNSVFISFVSVHFWISHTALYLPPRLCARMWSQSFWTHKPFPYGPQRMQLLLCNLCVITLMSSHNPTILLSTAPALLSVDTVQVLWLQCHEPDFSRNNVVRTHHHGNKVKLRYSTWRQKVRVLNVLCCYAKGREPQSNTDCSFKRS